MRINSERREILLVAVCVIDPAVLLVGIHFNIVQCHRRSVVMERS